MKKSFMITLALCLSFFVSTASAVDVTRLGPKQYDRTNGKPNVYTDTFRAYDNAGAIIVTNGDASGDHRISSAVITLNDQVIFRQNQFNQNVDRLESAVDLNESNTLTVDLRSQPGSYLTITIIQDVEPPTAGISADPSSIIFEEASSVLTWTSTHADTVTIDHGIGQVGPAGSITVSPEETTTYTITAVNDGGTATASTTLTVTYRPPTVGISANPESMLIGTSSTLSWNSTRADTAVIDNGIGPVNVNGSTIVSPSETTTYTIMVTGRGGTAVSTATVTVTYPPPIIGISAHPVSILLGESTTLSWTSVYADSVVIDNDVGSVSPNGSISVSPTETTTYTMLATGPGGSSATTVTVEVIKPPTVDMTASPLTIYKGESTTLSWTSANAGTCFVEPGIGEVPVNGSVSVSPQETTTYTILAAGPGGAASDTITIIVEDPSAPPAIYINASPSTIPMGGSTTLSWSSDNADSAYIDNGIGNVPVNGSISVSPDNTTAYTITVTNSFGNASAQIVVYVTGNPEPQPEGHFGAQYEDLTPQDATITQYDPLRFALITGSVQTIDASPIMNVAITILDHPEYGTAFTDSNGTFSIPVEGGGVLTVVYSKKGLLSAQRQVDVPWNDIAIAETIQMIEQDSAATAVTFDGSADTIITHQSTKVSDEFGLRSCTMVFTGDNKAYLVDKEGNDVQELTTINTRATEYTTPESMPAVLPPTSAYTYCAELEVDGAQRVRFDKPIITWVDNFLGFDVGSVVPVGYYDRDRGVWVPSDNGVVVKLLDTNSDGIADALDADGDDQPDDLNSNGFFNDEVKGLKDLSKYMPGSTFWRVEISHFSPCDLNFAPSPPLDSIYPNPEGQLSLDIEDIPCFVRGTLINTALGLKPIEELAEGDYVISKREDSNNTILRKVTRKFITSGQSTMNLKFNNSKGEIETFGVTKEHPFWSKDRGWVAAINLQLNEKVYALEGGWSTFAGIDSSSSGETVYNIEVEESHTYFVGENGLWVHNTCKAKVDPRKRTIHEIINIPGTDISLNYLSNRVSGYKTALSVPASGSTVPLSLKRIIVKMRLAGNEFSNILDPLPNQMTEFKWDGLDHLGRKISGTKVAHVSIGFVYDMFYFIPDEFAQPGRVPTTIRSRQEKIYWMNKNHLLHIFDEQKSEGRGSIAEGWTISSHHQLHPIDLNTLYKGDGSIINKNLLIITRVAGNGISGYYPDEGGGPADDIPATEALLNRPSGIAIDSAGNIYIADMGNRRIRKVDKNGIITTFAGNGKWGYSGDGGPATEARLYSPQDVAADFKGNIYIADTGNHRIRKVDPSGIITTVAGNGEMGYNGDDRLAIEASLNQPYGVSVDSVGNIYIADLYNNRIRKINPSGFITTIAGNGVSGYSGDGGLATEASLYWPLDTVVDSSGNIYISDMMNHRIRKVDPGGIITTFAGNGEESYGGDNGPATEASLAPGGLAIDLAENIYVADVINNRIRKIDTSAIITTFAGNGIGWYRGDEIPATEASLSRPYSVAAGQTGKIYIADSFANRIRKVAYPFNLTHGMLLNDIIFSEKNGLLHTMYSSGLHKNTIDSATRIILKEFSYNESNQLVSITDQFNNQIILERDGSGVLTAIISPDGLRTGLSIDTNNHLKRITYPDGSYYRFEYTPDGLMTAEVEPEGNRFEHVFTPEGGKLKDATDEEGGHWNYLKTFSSNGDIISKEISGEGNETSYLDHTFSTGAYTSTTTDPTGIQMLYSLSADGLEANNSHPCNGMELTFKYGVDSEYKFKALKEMKESTPSSLEKITLFAKTYQDTNSDKVPDIITETVTVNGRATTIKDNTDLSQKIITSPLGKTVTSFYDPDTLVTDKVSIPGLYDTTYDYDSKGRLTSFQTNTRESSFTYTSKGFLESITDPENKTTAYTHDSLGRVTGILRPDGSSIGFTYDQNGNMTVLTNPATINHLFSYNKVNKNSSYQTPISGTYSYVYDKDRRLIQTNFPSGYSINNIYDKTRLMQIQTPESTIDFTYLCGTTVGSVTNGMNSIAYSYDGSLLTSETLSGTLNLVLGYAYNNDFNLKSFTYAGSTANYTYDNDGLLTGAGGYTITRNTQNGLPESVTGGALAIARSFNGYGEVASQSVTISSQNATSWNLIRDNNGRITRKTETISGSTSVYDYTYDATGRLLTVTKNSTLVERYQYDLKGTRNYEMNSLRGISGRGFTYSDEDHLFTAGSASYNYDVDGFLISRTEGSATTQYNYSQRGELLSATLPNNSIIEYIHDPLGRRIAKKVNGAIVEKYLWHGLTTLLAVYDGSNSLLMRFQYADARMPVSMAKAGSTYYLTYDQVGSLRTVADASGNVVKRIDYDSFGNIINDSNPTFTVPFGFAGGLHDRDTGLVRFGFRDYDPDIGRWTAKDPIGFAGGDSDLYGYCLNDPVNLIDPNGLVDRAIVPQHVIDNAQNVVKRIANNSFTNSEISRLTDLIIETISYNPFAAASVLDAEKLGSVNHTACPLTLNEEQATSIENIFKSLEKDELSKQDRGLVNSAKEAYDKAIKNKKIVIKKKLK